MVSLRLPLQVSEMCLCIARQLWAWASPLACQLLRRELAAQSVAPAELVQAMCPSGPSEEDVAAWLREAPEAPPAPSLKAHVYKLLCWLPEPRSWRCVHCGISALELQTPSSVGLGELKAHTVKCGGGVPAERRKEKAIRIAADTPAAYAGEGGSRSPVNSPRSRFDQAVGDRTQRCPVEGCGIFVQPGKGLLTHLGMKVKDRCPEHTAYQELQKRQPGSNPQLVAPGTAQSSPPSRKISSPRKSPTPSAKISPTPSAKRKAHHMEMSPFKDAEPTTHSAKEGQAEPLALPPAVHAHSEQVEASNTQILPTSGVGNAAVTNSASSS